MYYYIYFRMTIYEFGWESSNDPVQQASETDMLKVRPYETWVSNIKRQCIKLYQVREKRSADAVREAQSEAIEAIEANRGQGGLPWGTTMPLTSVSLYISRLRKQIVPQQVLDEDEGGVRASRMQAKTTLRNYIRGKQYEAKRALMAWVAAEERKAWATDIDFDARCRAMRRRELAAGRKRPPKWHIARSHWLSTVSRLERMSFQEFENIMVERDPLYKRLRTDLAPKKNKQPHYW